MWSSFANQIECHCNWRRAKADIWPLIRIITIQYRNVCLHSHAQYVRLSAVHVRTSKDGRSSVSMASVPSPVRMCVHISRVSIKSRTLTFVGLPSKTNRHQPDAETPSVDFESPFEKGRITDNVPLIDSYNLFTGPPLSCVPPFFIDSSITPC